MGAIQENQAELVALFKAGLGGNAASYARFLRDVAPLLRAVVAKKIPMADVEDVVQEVLVSVHKARHTYDGTRPLLPWLMAIAHYRISDQLRRFYGTHQHKTVDIADIPEMSADVTFSAGENEPIDKLLGNSSDRERRILTMMHVHGYTAKETGAQLGMKESAVKVAAHRAIKKIREALST